MTSVGSAIAMMGVICILTAAATEPCDMLWGLWNPSQPWNGDNMASTASLDAKIGRSSDIVHWYANWGDGSGDMVHPWNVPKYIDVAQNFTSLAQTQHIPMLTWQPWGNKFTVTPAEYPLTSIANGTYDDYINSWATGLKALKKSIFLRPMHEFDGTWYPWGNVNGNTATQFIAAWIHIHNLFTSANATNVIFVWCPNNSNNDGVDQTKYYPGDNYVDWVGIDLYSDGPSFKQTITTYCNPQNLYGRLTAMTSKPIMIAEFGIEAGNGVSQAAWIRQAVSDIQSSMSQIKALVYFNQYGYTLNTSASDFNTISSTLGGGCAPSRAIDYNIVQSAPTKSSTSRSTTSYTTSQKTTSSTSPSTTKSTSSSTTRSTTSSSTTRSTTSSTTSAASTTRPSTYANTPSTTTSTPPAAAASDTCQTASYCPSNLCACGGACYSQNQYCCKNGQLSQIMFCL